MRKLFFNLSTKKLLIIGTVLIVFIFIDRTNISFLPVCHSNNLDEQVHVSEPTFVSKNEIAFAKFFMRYRKPVGICTLPNGGTPLIVNKQIQIYKAQENSSYVMVQAQNLPDEVKWPTGFEVTNLYADNGNLFFWILSDGTASQKRLYYSLSLSDHEIELVNSETISNILKTDWNLKRFSPEDDSLIINYDSDVGIGVFRSGPLVYDSMHNQVVQGTSPKLEKIWLSKDILESLPFKENI